MRAQSTIGPISAKHRWLRFSLRTLFVAITLFCAWVGLQAHRARRQALAIATIQGLGGSVVFDYQRGSNGAIDRNAKPTSSAWMRRTLGEEYFRRVAMVGLNMSNSEIRPDGLVDADLAVFRDLPDVETAELSNSPSITDNGLIHLAGLSKLKTLYLYNTGVTGPGLRRLSCLRSLEGLDVSNSPFTDEGMALLGRFVNLKWLSLNNTRISNDGLRQLSILSSLESLQLMNTDAADAGLEHIQHLTSLKQAAFHNTYVTVQGIARLRKSLPGCSVAPRLDTLRPSRDIPLWSPDHRPLRSELLGIVKELRGSAREKQGLFGTPIVSFSLSGSDISDASLLRVLFEMPDLEELHLNLLVVGDALLAGLRHNPKLRRLYLDQTCITDDGLQHLGQLPELRELNLSETRISDRGLVHLEGHTRLKYVRVANTRVGAAGMRAFKQKMPGCTIVR